MSGHSDLKRIGGGFGAPPRVRVLLALFAMVVLVYWIAAGVFQRAAVAQETVNVSVGDFFFDPASVTVSVGDTITWTNNGEEPHTSTSGVSPDPDGTWDSGVIDPGGSFSQTFDSAGTFEYFCTIHPTLMSGTVVVQQTATTTTAAETTTTTAAETTTTTAAEATTTTAEGATTTTAEVTTTAVAAEELPVTGSGVGVFAGVALTVLVLGSLILITARSRQKTD